MDGGEREVIRPDIEMKMEDKEVSATLRLNEKTDSESKIVSVRIPSNTISFQKLEDRWVEPRTDVGINVEVSQEECPSEVRVDLVRKDTGEVLDRFEDRLAAGEARTNALSFEMIPDVFEVQAISYVRPVEEWIQKDTSGTIEMFPARSLFIDSSRGVEIYGDAERAVPYRILVAATDVEGEGLEETDEVYGVFRIYLWSGEAGAKDMDKISFSNMVGFAGSFGIRSFVVDDGSEKGWKEKYRTQRLPFPQPIKRSLVTHLPSERIQKGNEMITLR